MSNKLNIFRKYLVYRHRKFTDAEKLKKFQQKKVAKQLDFVTSHSPFYARMKGKRLEEYLVMDKESMMENFNELNTVGIDKEEALSFAIESERTREFSPRLHGVTIGLSSGTSHSRGLFLVGDDEQDQWAAYVLAKFLPRSILKPCKIAFFMRADSNLYQSVRSKTVQFTFFDIYKDMKENIKKLQEVGADMLVAQPSVLLNIAEAINAGELDIHPARIISIAEVLEEKDAEIIKKSLGVDVIHQAYQCTEGCLATTCEYGTLHLNEDLVYFEKERIDEQRFIPILTDFSRTSQPIIRYRMNDVLVERKTPCPCGCAFTALEKIEGREDDVFLFEKCNREKEIENKETTNKETTNFVRIYPDFIRRCILFAGEITHYRVVQLEDGNIDIYANIEDCMKENVIKEFETMFKDHSCKPVELHFKDYEVEKGRKLKRVESLRKA